MRTSMAYFAGAGTVVAAVVARVRDGVHVVPCRLFLLELQQGPEADLLSQRLAAQDVRFQPVVQVQS